MQLFLYNKMVFRKQTFFKTGFSKAEQNRTASLFKTLNFSQSLLGLTGTKLQETTITPTDEARAWMKESIQTLLT